MHGYITLLLTSVTIWACQPTSSGSQNTAALGDAGRPLEVYDSSGIEIVVFGLSGVHDYGVVSSNADWTFGQSSDDPVGIPLGNVVDAVLLSDGTVAILNGETQEVVVVDPTTDGWHRFGGRGDGPQEFRFVASVTETENGIGVFDEYRQRWVTFQDGRLVGSVSIPDTGVPGIHYPEVVIPDGKEFIVGDAYFPPGTIGGEVTRRLLLIARLKIDAVDAVDTLKVVPGDSGTPRPPGLLPYPWVPTYGLAVSDSGIWVGDTAVPAIWRMSRTGQLERIARWASDTDRSLSREVINAYRDRVSSGRPNEVRRRIRSNFRTQEFPAHVPAWGQLLVGAGGTVWVSDYPGQAVQWPLEDPYPAQLWWAIGQDGRPLGSLLSPPGLRVTYFGHDVLIGVHKDDLGVETVRRHRISIRSKDPM